MAHPLPILPLTFIRKATASRRSGSLILDAVRRAEEHVTPGAGLRDVHRQNPAISRTTIYRTLDFLV